MLARIFSAFSLILILSSPALAQSQDIDIRAQASRVTGDALISAFSGTTHDGAYNFSAQGRPTDFYTEKHYADGRVEYTEGDKTHDGDWAVFRDRLCYSYDDINQSGGCFRVYKIGTCFYFYSNTLVEMPNELDRDYWTARSIHKGDEATCEAVFS